MYNFFSKINNLDITDRHICICNYVCFFYKYTYIAYNNLIIDNWNDIP